MKKCRAKRQTMPKTIRLSCLLLSTLFLIGSFSLIGQKDVWATSTTQRIEDARDEKRETEKQLEEVRDKVERLSSEASALSGELRQLRNLSDEQQAQYERLSAELEAALVARAEALDEYITSQENLEEKRLEYSERMSAMFEYQNRSFLELLLESDSIAGFFTNLELISLIGDADAQIVEQLQAALDDAELKSETTLQTADHMQYVAEEKEHQLLELEMLIGETTEALEEKQLELSEWEKKELELEKEGEKLGAQIAALQRDLVRPPNAPTNPPPQGEMTWPYPGDYRVYSGFGMRWHPVYGGYRMHYGVDLGGSYGNPIVAAADGVVIRVQTPVPGRNTGGTGYGNNVMIDHGGNVVTIYAHCKDVYVSYGQVVSAGQTIASCGSTGTSTGPHLHFEVRVNGTAVNPLLYIT